MMDNVTKLDIDDWKKLAINLGLANKEKENRITSLESAMQEFAENFENANDHPGQIIAAVSFCGKIKNLLQGKKCNVILF